jgi:hypothetical protein
LEPSKPFGVLKTDKKSDNRCFNKKNGVRFSVRIHGVKLNENRSSEINNNPIFLNETKESGFLVG